MTLGGLEADLYRRLNHAASPATTVTTRLRAMLNETHREILGRPGFGRMRRFTIPVTSVADQATLGIPQSIARIHSIQDRTNDRYLDRIFLDEIRRRDPGLDQNGDPSHYALVGRQQVQIQPADASEIFVDSTSASDTNTCFIEGIRTGGYRVTLSVTMTGVTAVSLSATITDLIAITKFYLSAVAVGTVTLHEDDSGGTELARIPIGQTYARYIHVQLWPEPDAAVTYHVDHTRVIEDMTNANDEPLLPEDFHQLVGIGVRMKEYEHLAALGNQSAMQRYQVANGQWTQRITDLEYFIFNAPDFAPVMRGGAAPGFSQLGPDFPAGS